MTTLETILVIMLGCCAVVLTYLAGYLLGKVKRLEHLLRDVEEALRVERDRRSEQVIYMDNRLIGITELSSEMGETFRKLIEDNEEMTHRLRNDCTKTLDYLNASINSLWANSKALEERMQSISDDICGLKEGSKEVEIA